MTNQETSRALGALVKKYRGPMTQTAVAELLSRHLGEPIRQGWVSEHERGMRWSDDKWLRAYIEVLGIPEDEMARAFGFTISEADGPRQPKTFRELVEADPTLSKAAKEHLVNQYGLLQLASKHDTGTSPASESKEKSTRSRRTSA